MLTDFQRSRTPAVRFGAWLAHAAIFMVVWIIGCAIMDCILKWESRAYVMLYGYIVARFSSWLADLSKSGCANAKLSDGGHKTP